MQSVSECDTQKDLFGWFLSVILRDVPFFRSASRGRFALSMYAEQEWPFGAEKTKVLP